MIDFDKGQEELNKFGGTERKTTILYDGDIYMVKYPDPVIRVTPTDTLCYRHNQFSEYIGSSIFRLCGIKTQETTLGFYTAGTRKVVVGCKDFTPNGEKLYETNKLVLSIGIDEDKLETTIETFNRIVDETRPPIGNRIALKNAFWDMFVIDALIGNKDRHLGNLGVLRKDGEFAFAPVYDCGYALSAMLSDDIMKVFLDNSIEFDKEEYYVPSVYRMSGKRIYYHEIFGNPPEELSEAIKRVVPNINMGKIHELVDLTEKMSEVRKEYLKKALSLRYERILKPALTAILSK